MWAVRVVTWNSKVVEPVAEIAHKPAPCTNDLRTWQHLEAAHRAYPPFEMLMVTLDALLFQLAPDVHNFRHDCGKRRRIDRRPVSRR